MPFSSPTREWLWGGGPSPISHHLLTSISLSPIRANDACSTAYSFCGLKDKLYPDRRTMGYPFDRRLPNANLTELVGALLKNVYFIIPSPLAIARHWTSISWAT